MYKINFLLLWVCKHHQLEIGLEKLSVQSNNQINIPIRVYYRPLPTRKRLEGMYIHLNPTACNNNRSTPLDPLWHGLLTFFKDYIPGGKPGYLQLDRAERLHSQKLQDMRIETNVPCCCLCVCGQFFPFLSLSLSLSDLFLRGKKSSSTK